MIADEIRKQHIQTVVHRDEFVPVLSATAQLSLVLGKCLPREIVLLERRENIFVRETRAVERDAYARGEDWVDKTSRIADQHEAVANQLLHGIAVIAFVLEGTNAIGLAQGLGNQRPAPHCLPEKLFAVFLRLGEVLFLRDHAQAGDGVSDRNLPDPGIRNRQEVDVDVIEVRVALREDFAIVAVKPGVDGVLIEHSIFDFQLELIAKESLAAAAIHNHLAVDTHFLGADVEVNIRILGAEIYASHFDAVVDSCSEFLRVLQQHQVELAAIHMVGIVSVLHTFLFSFLETDVHVVLGRQSLEVVNVSGIFVIGRPDSTELVRELGFFHLTDEIEVFEDTGGRRNQRLAHVRTWKQLAFEHDALDAGLRQVARHARSGRAASNNSYFKIGYGMIHIR